MLDSELDKLITSYHELNSESIEELQEEPSPLDFMRYVSRNRPFVVRQGARQWAALERWNLEYLTDIMSGQSVNIAMTPSGNADSVLHMNNGTAIFIKPHEFEVSFGRAAKYIAQQELNDTGGPVCYCQTQNDNLRNEYEPLFKDVPRSVPFARIALQRDPDAVNFWLGNSRSVTALHKDPYENIYVQVLGRKHFALLPPTESACVNERVHAAATYRSDDSAGADVDLEAVKVHPVLDDPPAEVPFAVWDPDVPEENTTALSHLGRPMRVTLNPGDMLYLPALWYHKVSQSCNREGLCCAVNYWYDMEYSGSFYPLTGFARRVGLMATSSNAFKHE